MAVTQFGAPIPGQSLTSNKPGDRAWERPPELSTVEDALSMYMSKLAKQEIVDDLMVALEAEVPIKPLVESLYMASVMRGLHSLDIGLLVAPALMDFIAAVADTYGVEYKFSNKDVKTEMEEKERARMSLLISSALEKAKREGEEDEGTGLLESMSAYLESDATREETEDMAGQQEMPMEEEAPMEEEVVAEENVEQQPQMPEQSGLMARG
tara:strand:+ start:51 stop:683 length:633 start_codon:yes stop_codon:yes gene_type:complete